MTAFVVTTSAFGSSKTQIWHPSRPLPLGHPFQWVLERTGSGLRIRDISQTHSEIQSNRLQEISEAQLKAGANVELAGKNPISLRIREAAELAPAFTDKSGSAATVYTCSGNWVLSSTLLDDSHRVFTGTVTGQKHFSLKRESDGQYTLHSLIKTGKSGASPISLQLEGEAPRELKPEESIQLAAEKLLGSSIVSGSYRWCFGLSGIPTVPASPASRIVDPENKLFHNSLRYSAIGLVTFIALSWIWPKPKVDTQEIIPPQYAKILLQKPKEKAASSAPAASAATAPTEKVASNAALPKKVQDAAVVQAFRAKALSNAVNGLLKGGMTRLLAQSDFVSGGKASQEARRIFDSKSVDLKATAPDIGLSASKNVQVAALGGTAGSTGKVGYGKGEHAGVKNQGGSFVTMDTGGSSVDEGLTKDEVGEVIHRHLSEVRYCYESAMVRTPDIEGKLMVNFTIGGKGLVKSSEVKSSTLPDPRLDDCILRRLATWKFPQPRGGIDVAVTYPFIFKTLGR